MKKCLNGFYGSMFFGLLALASTILVNGSFALANNDATENTPVNQSKENTLTTNMIPNPGFEERLPTDEEQTINEQTSDGQANDEPKQIIPQWKFLALEAGATLTIDETDPVCPKHPSSARIEIEGLTDHGAVLLESSGYKGDDGIMVKKNNEYQLSFYAKANGAIKSLEVIIPKLEGDTLAHASITQLTTKWKKYEVTLKPSEDYTQGRLIFSFNKPGAIWLDEIELVPLTVKKEAAATTAR